MANIPIALQHELSLMRDPPSRPKDDPTSGEVNYYADLLHEIRDIRITHQEALTQYTIKVAVLENDLE